MQYLLLAYYEEKQWEALPAADRDALATAASTIEQELRQSGHLLAAEELQNSNVLTVRVVDGKVSLSEGPFVSTKGPLHRLFFIEARDLNEAIQVAAKMPQTRSGSIEVRPLLGFNQPYGAE
jgi:hypothetical protein